MGKYGPYTAGKPTTDSLDIRFRTCEKDSVDEYDRIVQRTANCLEKFERNHDVHDLFEAQYNYGYARAFFYYVMGERSLGDANTSRVVALNRELQDIITKIDNALRSVSKTFADYGGYTLDR